ncbi:hypothetical protein GCM10020367_39790 [Streptomyces sannanensis]|uniref:ATP-binding protein n=1 Tax=Streptomyces sannanensis TaxID=285536 RepID=A0ABP6SFC2_9ACTN
MPRHILLRAGLTITAAAAAALGAGGAAHAAGVDTPVGEVGPDTAQGVLDGVAYAITPVKTLRLNPLAKTGADPLDNTVGTQVADFQQVSTAAATGPLAQGAALKDLPVVGQVSGLLPG